MGPEALTLREKSGHVFFEENGRAWRRNCFTDNCECLSHKTWYEVDVKKLRRQIEDRLRKGTQKEIVQVAQMLNMDISRADIY